LVAHPALRLARRIQPEGRILSHRARCRNQPAQLPRSDRRRGPL